MVLAISKKVLAFLLLFGVAALIIATLIIVYRLDILINVDLYNYGLTEGPWLFDYWIYVRLSLILISLAIIANFLGLIYFSSKKPTEIQSVKTYFVAVKGRFSLEQKVSFALLGIGTVMMVVSIYFSLSIISFISIGLIFWGVLFLYIRNEKYVKEQLLEKTTFSFLRNMDDTLAKIGNTIIASYAPPRFLEEFQSDRVLLFIKNEASKGHGKEQADTSERIVEMELEPPGSGLAQLIEDIMGTNFSRMNLQSFYQRILKVLTEELEIAQDVHISTENDVVNIKLVGSPFTIICGDTVKLERIHNSIGCPICSAFACILAKATGKFIAIKSEQPNKEKRVINTEYLLLDHPTRR